MAGGLGRKPTLQEQIGQISAEITVLWLELGKEKRVNTRTTERLLVSAETTILWLDLGSENRVNTPTTERLLASVETTEQYYGWIQAGRTEPTPPATVRLLVSAETTVFWLVLSRENKVNNI